MKIGEVIRSWRRIKDLGVREAGSEIGISHGTVSRIERGERIDAATLMKLMTWLFDGQLVSRASAAKKGRK